MNRIGYDDETDGAGDCANSPGPVASNLRRGAHMDNSSERVPFDAAVKCPLCDSTGWPSSLLTQGYSAECGSAWDVAGFVRQSPACHTISALRMEIATLQILAVAS